MALTMAAVFVRYVSLIMKWDHDGAGLPLALLLSGSLAWLACAGLGVPEYTPLWFGLITAFYIALLPPLCFVCGWLIQLGVRALKKQRV